MSSAHIFEGLKGNKNKFPANWDLPLVEDFHDDEAISNFSVPTASAAQFMASMFKADSGSESTDSERSIYELKRLWGLCMKIEGERTKMLDERRRQESIYDKRNAQLKSSLDVAERDLAFLKRKIAQAEASASMLAIKDTDPVPASQGNHVGNGVASEPERRAHPTDTDQIYYTFEEWVEFARSIGKPNPEEAGRKLWNESKPPLARHDSMTSQEADCNSWEEAKLSPAREDAEHRRDDHDGYASKEKEGDEVKADTDEKASGTQATHDVSASTAANGTSITSVDVILPASSARLQVTSQAADSDSESDDDGDENPWFDIQ